MSGAINSVTRDRTDATEHDDGGERGETEGGHRRRHPVPGGEDVGDRVRLDHVEGHSEREDEAHGEHHACRAGAEAALDVVGGPAAERVVVVRLLVDLREGGLGERRGHAEQRHDPHPEDRSRPTEREGDGDAGDVARAHAAREADAEGLEGADAALLPRPGSADHPHHRASGTELHAAGAQREEQAADGEEGDEAPLGEVLVRPRHEVVESFHRVFFREGWTGT